MSEAKARYGQTTLSTRPTSYSHERIGAESLTTTAACRAFLARAHSFIQQYSTLVEAHGNDMAFLTHRHYDTFVPLAWGDLTVLSVAALIQLPLGVVPANAPAELVAFVREAQACQLAPFPTPLSKSPVRKKDDEGRMEEVDRNRRESRKGKAGEIKEARETRSESDTPPTESTLDLDALVQAYTTATSILPSACHVRHFLGTTEKKRDEMLKMAALVAATAKAQEVEHVVDIGCGKGYLSTLLASQHGLSVLGIEQSANTAAAASERTESVRKRLPKSNGEAVSLRLAVKAARVRLQGEADSVPMETLLDNEGVVGFTVLVGLHICGDLLPDCLRCFVNSPRIAACVLVGCCYNMLTETEGKGQDAREGKEKGGREVEENYKEDRKLERKEVGENLESSCTCHLGSTDDERNKTLCMTVSRFPLSAFGCCLGAHLGRRLRNAACHSVFEWPHQQAVAEEEMPGGEGSCSEKGGLPSECQHEAPSSSSWTDRLVYTSTYRAVLGLYMQQHHLSTTIKWGRTFQNVKRKPLFGDWAAQLLTRHCFASTAAVDSKKNDIERTGDEIGDDGVTKEYFSPSATRSTSPKPFSTTTIHTPTKLQSFYDLHSADCIPKLFVFEALAGTILPVLESFVVVDRLLFLLELHYPAIVRPLFDPALSPRNWVLMAARKRSDVLAGEE